MIAMQMASWKLEKMLRYREGIMIRRQKGIVCLMTGIATVFIGYLAWGLLTVFHKSGSFGMAGFLISLLTMILYALFHYTVALMGRKEIGRQLLVVSGWGGLLCLLLLLRGGGSLISQGEYTKLWLNLLWLADFMGCCFFLGRHIKSFSDGGEKRKTLADGCKEHLSTEWKRRKWFYILLVITALLLIEPRAVQFKWDGLLYHLACQNLYIDSISSLALYGHIAQTYGMLNGLGMLILGDMVVAMIGLNIALLLCSICAFYGIIKCIVPGKSDFVYALAAAVYAWSPFTLGMVYYHNLDFYCQCFFVIMLYFLYRRQWIYFFVTSLLFCFTKEPAILIYGAMCVGIVILDFTAQKGKPFIRRLEKLLRTGQYYFMVLPGILWLATYKILGPWSAGVGGFQPDGAYVIEKLKALYVFQFNWLFTGLCICGVIFSIAKKRRKVLNCLFPVLCGQIAFTVFSCAFKTVNHPRYNGASQPALYCMAVLLLFDLLGYLYGRLIAGGIVVIMAASCFYTLDPITRLCFPQYDIGNTVMVTTGTTPLGDGMIYNRQMLWLEHVMELALEDSLSQSNLVLFPALGGSTYFFDGMAETATVDGDCRLEQEYWNADTGRRMTAPGDTVQVFMVGQLSETPDWDRLAEEIDGTASYCYLSCAGEQRAEQIRKHFQVLEEKEYVYRGWKVYRICFE